MFVTENEDARLVRPLAFARPSDCKAFARPNDCKTFARARSAAAMVDDPVMLTLRENDRVTLESRGVGVVLTTLLPSERAMSSRDKRGLAENIA